MLYSDLDGMDDYLLMGMQRQKTRQQHSLSLTPSAVIWDVDPIHAIAALLVTDPYDFSTEVFTQIGVVRGEQDRVAAYINRFPQTTVQYRNLDVTQHFKSHSARRGSVTKPASSEAANFSDLAHRGASSVNDFHTVLMYIAETSSADQRVAKPSKEGGGWKQPRHNFT